MITDLALLLISGLATGAIYALVAAGFALLWQTSQTVNFAQGDFVVLPAFVALGAISFGLPFWAAVIVALVVAVLVLGVLFKRAMVDPLLQNDVLPLVIATIALGMLIQPATVTTLHAKCLMAPCLLTKEHLFISTQDLRQ